MLLGDRKRGDHYGKAWAAPIVALNQLCSRSKTARRFLYGIRSHGRYALTIVGLGGEIPLKECGSIEAIESWNTPPWDHDSYAEPGTPSQNTEHTSIPLSEVLRIDCYVLYCRIGCGLSKM